MDKTRAAIRRQKEHKARWETIKKILIILEIISNLVTLWKVFF